MLLGLNVKYPRHTMGSKSVAFLKTVLAIPTVLTLLFGIFLLILSQWVTGALWCAAGILGLLALSAHSGKGVLALYMCYVLLMFASFICHIVYLSILGFENHQDSGAASDSNVFKANSYETDKTVHIIGIIASIILLFLTFPLYLLLAKKIRTYNRKFDREQSVENSEMPLSTAYSNQQLGQQPQHAEPPKTGPAEPAYPAEQQYIQSNQSSAVPQYSANDPGYTHQQYPDYAEFPNGRPSQYGAAEPHPAEYPPQGPTSQY